MKELPDHPQLSKLFRLQWEQAQDSYVLLYPEGMVQLNTSAAEILKRCDGIRDVSAIVADLESAFSASGLRPDVEEFLLAALARTLSDAGLEITSAHIDGYGERAVDAFYVVDEAGAKLTDTRKGNALKAALLSALNASETEAGQARRANLPRARASVAR